jgi:glutathione synthase/RimK-type ligase-like ATP-grasp enzyme
MKRNKITLVTGNNNFFGQTRKPWVSLNVSKLADFLKQGNYEVDLYQFHQLINNPDLISNSIIIYSFSQKINRRDYIKDLIHYYATGNNTLIPSYDLLQCHENKGFQELYKKKLNIKSLPALYFCSESEIEKYEINYPVVLKTVDGSNGKGVYLIKSKDELHIKIKKLQKLSLLTKADLFRRKYFRKKKQYIDYPEYNNHNDFIQYKDYITEEKNFILQEFIPELKYDYRVLIIYNRYFVTKRENRDNDFRASGSKRFRFNFEASDQLLNYAEEMYNKFDTPFLSIDIAQNKGKYYLLEFQALHFGINVLVKSKGFYSKEKNNWNFIENNNVIEDQLGYGLIQYLQSKYKN